MRKSEDEIKRRYARRRKWINVTWLLNFTLLPLIGLLYLLFKDNAFLGNAFMVMLWAYCIFALFISWVVWRCPSCHMVFSKYVFNPEKCPYCGVRLR